MKKTPNLSSSSKFNLSFVDYAERDMRFGWLPTKQMQIFLIAKFTKSLNIMVE